MINDERIRQIIERLENQTDEEAEAVMEALVQEGIIDSEWNVLVRRPEWAKPANGKPAESRSKKKSARKR